VVVVPSPADIPEHDPFPYFNKFLSGQPQEDVNWVLDMELMHHFITSTFRTISMSSAGDETDRIWQIEVPKQAFAHNVFLLHHILALSSYHLAYLQPERRQMYSLRASHHQSLGVRGMRIALGSITPDNCHALFISASVLFLCALAASSGAQPTVDDLIDVFLLVKGIGSVLQSSDAVLRSGPFSSLFLQQGPAEQVNVTLGRVTLALEEFTAGLVESELGAGVRGIIHVEATRLIETIQEARLTTQAPEYRYGCRPGLRGVSAANL
jgi:hypothetical protein